MWETFKVYDGQIHAVEAFMRILPEEKRNGRVGVAPAPQTPECGTWENCEGKDSSLRTPFAQPIGRGVFRSSRAMARQTRIDE